MRIGPRVRRLVTPLLDQIVYASNAYVDLKSVQVEQASDLIDLGRPPAGPADERLLAAVALIRPWEPVDARWLRVGADGDGGYVMVDDFAVTGALSIGVGPDVSWDVDVARRGIPVAMFDPTVRRLPAPVPGGRFFRIGVADGPATGPDYRTLDDLARLSGLGAGDVLLKIDVEGAEWGALARPNDVLPRARQVVIEMHGWSRLRDEGRSRDVLAALEALARDHVPVHVHGNNYVPLVRYDSLWFPDAVEITYVRRDEVGDLRPADSIGSSLDRPSDPRVPDLDLRGLLGAAIHR